MKDSSSDIFFPSRIIETQARGILFSKKILTSENSSKSKKYITVVFFLNLNPLNLTLLVEIIKAK